MGNKHIKVILINTDTSTILEKLLNKEKKKKKEEPSSVFQRQRVDLLLKELAQKYPPKSLPLVPAPEKTGSSYISPHVLKTYGIQMTCDRVIPSIVR